MPIYFDTLNHGLIAHGLIEAYTAANMNHAIGYGDTARFSVAGKQVAVYRMDSGRYEFTVYGAR